MSRDGYLYAAGVIRHLETKLLDPTDLERMVDSEDLKAAFKVFHDTDFFDNVLDVSPREYLKALDADLLQAKQNLAEMLPDEKMLKLLFLRFDFHNLKLLLKAKYSQSNFDSQASDLGLVGYDVLKEAIKENRPEDLDDDYKNVLIKFNEEIGDTEPAPSLIDRIIDREYFKLYYQTAKAVKSKFVLEFAKLQFDIANIKIFIRSKILGLPAEEWLADMIDNGNLATDEYTNIAEKSVDEALGQLAQLLQFGTDEAVSDYLQHKSLAKLEQALEEVEMDYLRQAKYIDYGPEMILAYFYAKKSAIRNVRLIMTAKLNDLPASEIKTKTRELY